MRFSFLLVAAAGLAGPALAEPVTIAIVPSVPAASTLIAEEKGYFRDAGLEVTIERIDSMGKAVAFLAANHVQVAQGGINAGIFNAIGQGLPGHGPDSRRSRAAPQSGRGLCPLRT